MATNPADKYAKKTFGQLESQMSKQYREAYKDVSKKLQDFTRRHKAKDKQMQRDLKKGKITQEQYASWLRGQVFIGQQWQDTKASLDLSIKNVMTETAHLTHQKSIDVFVDNANYTAYQIEKDHGFTGGVNFQIYDRKTVSRLMLEDPELLPRGRDIDGNKLSAWNTKVIANCVTQSILQGESIDELSKRIARDTCIDAGRSSLLYARTAMTGAQNAGRVERMKEAEEMGIKVQKQWMSTLDSRTRDSHRDMDGEIADTDEEFSNGLEYPGDPSGDPREVYNCRCTLIYHYPEYSDYSNMERTAYYEEGDPEYDPDHRNYETVKGMNYEQWTNYKQDQIRQRYGGLPVEPVINPYDGLPTDMSWGEYRRTLRDKIPADLIGELENELLSGRGDMTMNEYWLSLIKGNTKNARIEELLRQMKASAEAQQGNERNKSDEQKQREERITRIMKSHTVDQMTPQQKQEFTEILGGMTNDMLELYEHMIPFHKDNNYTDGPGWYSPSDKKVEMTLKANKWEKTVGRTESTGAWKTKFHEELHQFDHLLGMAQGGSFMAEATHCVGGVWNPPTEMGLRMKSAIEKDVISFLNRGIDHYNKDLGLTGKRAIKHIEDLSKPIQREVRYGLFNMLGDMQREYGDQAKFRAMLSPLTDAIGLATNDRISPYSEGYWGHKPSYNKDRGINGATSECFAEIGSHIMRNDREALDFLQKYMPESIKEYDISLHEALEFVRDHPKELKYPKH